MRYLKDWVLDGKWQTLLSDELLLLCVFEWMNLRNYEFNRDCLEKVLLLRTLCLYNKNEDIILKMSFFQKK